MYWNIFFIFGSINQSAGLGWAVRMGRKDSLSASKASANNNIPGQNADVATFVAEFQNVGRTLDDRVTLSGNWMSPFCYIRCYH